MQSLRFLDFISLGQVFRFRFTGASYALATSGLRIGFALHKIRFCPLEKRLSIFFLGRVSFWLAWILKPTVKILRNLRILYSYLFAIAHKRLKQGAIFNFRKGVLFFSAPVRDATASLFQDSWLFGWNDYFCLNPLSVKGLAVGRYLVNNHI